MKRGVKVEVRVKNESKGKISWVGLINLVGWSISSAKELAVIKPALGTTLYFVSRRTLGFRQISTPCCFCFRCPLVLDHQKVRVEIFLCEDGFKWPQSPLCLVDGVRVSRCRISLTSPRFRLLHPSVYRVTTRRGLKNQPVLVFFEKGLAGTSILKEIILRTLWGVEKIRAFLAGVWRFDVSPLNRILLFKGTVFESVGLDHGTGTLCLNLDRFPIVGLENSSSGGGNGKAIGRFGNNLSEFFRLVMVYLLSPKTALDFGLARLMSMYFEAFEFKSPNKVLYRVFRDYEKDRNKTTYYYFWVISELVRNDYPLFSVEYLKLVTALFGPPMYGGATVERVDNKMNGLFGRQLQSSTRYFGTALYPRLTVEIQRIRVDHVFYTRLRVVWDSSNPPPDTRWVERWWWWCGSFSLECKFHERTGVNKVYLNVSPNHGGGGGGGVSGRRVGEKERFCEFYYNPRGKVFQIKKRGAVRKTKPPPPVLSYVEVNYNGKMPCQLVIKDEGLELQRMVNDCGNSFFTRMVALKSLTLMNETPNPTVLKDIIRETLFFSFLHDPAKSSSSSSSSPLQNGHPGSELIKPLYRFLFNPRVCRKSLDFDVLVNRYDHGPYNTRFISFAMGLYKKLFKVEGMSVYRPVQEPKNIYNPVLFTTRKCLLRQIALCSAVLGPKEKESVAIFFKEIVEDFRHQHQLTKTGSRGWSSSSSSSFGYHDGEFQTLLTKLEELYFKKKK
jgi:hypothetical protein